MVGIGSAMIDDDRSTDDYQQQRLACVSGIASRVRWIGSSRMDRVESVGSSRVESRICMHDGFVCMHRYKIFIALCRRSRFIMERAR
jgi:hypothetical protein